MENRKTELQKKKWYDNKFIVHLLLIMFFPAGFIVLWKSTTVALWWKILITIVAGFMLFITIVISGTNGIEEQKTENFTSNEIEKLPTIKDTLLTDYFQIILNKAYVSKTINTGNEFANLKAESGNTFLILNVTFKNIDNESRLFAEGSVFINYNGKLLEFDNTELILDEKWGSFLDQINPLISKTTNLVYKIPDGLEGQFLWEPGRNSKNKRFLLN